MLDLFDRQDGNKHFRVVYSSNMTCNRFSNTDQHKRDRIMAVNSLIISNFLLRVSSNEGERNITYGAKAYLMRECWENQVLL